MKAVLVHYGEIALKGNNRRDFEERLANNIRLSLKPVLKQVKRLEGRIVIFLKKHDRKTIEVARERLSKIFGISWFAFSDVCKTDMDNIKGTAIKATKGRLEKRTFKVDTTRAYKGFPYNSIQVNEILGDALIRRYRPKVSLDNPDVTVSVEIMKDRTFVYTDRIKGLDGLPVGSSGRVLVLLSGGIDSPVASWMIMKRGCSVDYLHIHAMRDNKSVKGSKVREIVEKLREFDPRSRLYAMPYHEFEVRVQSMPSKYNLILFRRFMFRSAERLANELGAKAIITGDSLGQVASQTIDSICVADECVDIPVFRPLLSYTKEDTVSLAKKIGTYGLSIRPYKDCCSIISRHPTTKPKLERAKSYESKMKIGSIVGKCVKSVSVV